MNCDHIKSSHVFFSQFNSLVYFLKHFISLLKISEKFSDSKSKGKITGPLKEETED